MDRQRYWKDAFRIGELGRKASLFSLAPEEVVRATVRLVGGSKAAQLLETPIGLWFPESAPPNTAGATYLREVRRGVWEPSRVCFHPCVLTDHYVGEDRKQSYLHELGHAVAALRFGEMGAEHGSLWGNTVRALGGNPRHTIQPP